MTILNRSLLVVLSVLGVTCARSTPVEPPRPAESIRLELLSADADVWSFEIAVRGVAHGPRGPQACSFRVGQREHPAQLEGRTFAAVLPLARGVNTVIASCSMPDGHRFDSAPVHYRVRLPEPAPGPASLDGGAPGPPDWLDDAVVYGVIPPLFGSPPLAAVTQALDELDELGVSALWLSPIFESPPDDFGYAVIDPFEVRREYGTERDLEQLVEAAHARDIRILLDFVPNHTSDQHPYYVQAKELGTRSHYYGFYERDERGDVTHYFDWKNLPNLDYDNPEVERYTLSSASYWIQSADIDGYRVDAAWGVRERAPSFWPRFSRDLKHIKPQLFLLAEASARDPYYVEQGFDAAYDWSEQLGHHAWEDVFSSPHGIAARLDAAVNRAESGLQTVFRFLNNNDTGERFITRHGEPLTRVATAALLTLPGIPCLYTFDEVGAEYRPYDELEPVKHMNAALRAFHKKLIALRRGQKALHAGGFVPLHVGSVDEAYVYARFDPASGAAAIVALNFSERPARVRASLPGSVKPRLFEDALSGKTLRPQRDSLVLALAPWDILVLLPKTTGIP